MTQLALPAPYRYKEGFHISLLAEDGFDEHRAEETIVQFGCPRRIAKKAISCLHYSNRYDCVVAPSWFAYESEHLHRQLANTGVRMHVQGEPDRNYPGKAAQKLRQGGPRVGFSDLAQAQNLPRKLDHTVYVPAPKFDFRELELRNAALTDRYARERYAKYD